MVHLISLLLPFAGRMQGFNLFAPLGKKEISAQSLPTAGRTPSRKGFFFALQKIN
jgi:hypothetical protein